jgi:hypothetical protein
MPRVKRHVSKKTTAFLLNKKADRKAERSANAENRRQKVAARKAIHEAKLAEMSEEARAAYDTKALRKREGRQRWLDEYRTLDKQTKLERRVAKKNATQAKRVARAARKEAKLKLAQVRSAKRDFRNNYKAMKSSWRRTEGESPQQTKQMKKALLYTVNSRMLIGKIPIGINMRMLKQKEEMLTEQKKLLPSY